MSLQIHNIRFRQVCCEHNKKTTFFTGVLFGVPIFSKIMLGSWGCGLYTSAAYTRVFTVSNLKKLELESVFKILINNGKTNMTGLSGHINRVK